MASGEKQLSGWILWGCNLGIVYFAGRVFSIDWLTCNGWWSSWIAMAVFILISARSEPRAALAYGFFFGLIALGSSFYWAERMLEYSLDQSGLVPRIVFSILIILESIPMAILGCLISVGRNQRPRLGFPTAKSNRSIPSTGLGVAFAFWILVESFWPRVFAWTLGHSQQGWNALTQIADLGGPSLISWLVLWIAAIPLLLSDHLSTSTQAVIDHRRASSFAVVLTLACLIATLFYGNRQIDYWSRDDWGDEFRVAVVQEDPSYVESIAKMRHATLALDASIDLIIWPESTLGTISTRLKSLEDPETLRAHSLPPFTDTAPLLGLPTTLIVGGRSFDGPADEGVAQHQSAFVVQPDGRIQGHYHKRKLMPLGEYVPGEWRWPQLHEWFQLNEYIVPGTDASPITLPDQSKVGVLICFEDIVSSTVRETVLQGAEVLVCLINASAFEDPIALQQHLLLARLRATENRRYLVRVAGTGVSCVVGPTGDIVYRSPVLASDAFVAKTYRSVELTMFTRMGDWVTKLAGIVLLGVVAMPRMFKGLRWRRRC